jgi:hypothetical protein
MGYANAAEANCALTPRKVTGCRLTGAPQTPSTPAASRSPPHRSNPLRRENEAVRLSVLLVEKDACSRPSCFARCAVTGSSAWCSRKCRRNGCGLRAVPGPPSCRFAFRRQSSRVTDQNSPKGRRVFCKASNCSRTDSQAFPPAPVLPRRSDNRPLFYETPHILQLSNSRHTRLFDHIVRTIWRWLRWKVGTKLPIKAIHAAIATFAVFARFDV